MAKMIKAYGQNIHKSVVPGSILEISHTKNPTSQRMVKASSGSLATNNINPYSTATF
jgi:hypothetical protein